MRKAWVKFGGVVGAVIVPLFGLSAQAADQAGSGRAGWTNVAAEELTQRSKQPESSKSGGLSDSSVRVMMTYATSLIPDKVPGPDGKPMAVDKSDPGKYVIPNDAARRVIRAATRTAYADVCGLPELGQANYQAMLAQEKARETWSQEQILLIEALHLFAVSYFSGRAKIIEEPEATAEDGSTTVAKADEAAQPKEVAAPPPPKCPPEQREKVQSAINAYVASAKAQ